MSTVTKEATLPAVDAPLATNTEVSKTRAEAAVANAQLSTGPRTKEGKAVSAMNAIKHGARATKVVLPGEDPEEFEALRQELLAAHGPQTAGERQLVETIAALEWKRARLDRLEWEFWARALKPRADGTVSETPMADAFCTHHKEISLLLRYMGQTSRKLDRTVKELREMIKARKMAAALSDRWAERMAAAAAAVEGGEEEAVETAAVAGASVPLVVTANKPAAAPIVPQPRPAQRNSQFLPNRGRR